MSKFSRKHSPRIELSVQLNKPHVYFSAPGFVELSMQAVRHPDDHASLAEWPLFFQELGRKVFDSLLKAHTAAAARLERGEELPSPRLMVSECAETKIYDLSIAKFAQMRGMDINEVRREADSGNIPCRRTRGGHRKFSLLDL
ncbi:hypothetical protein WDW37_09115 [Bdellovibrionota bacterium FG-1]